MEVTHAAKDKPYVRELQQTLHNKDTSYCKDKVS